MNLPVMLSRLTARLSALKYNLLALIYVGLHFIFIALIGRLFGISSDSDVYFLAITLLAYLGHIVQAVWEAWTPWYVEQLKQDRKTADQLYAMFLIWISAAALLLMLLFYGFHAVWGRQEEAQLLNFMDWAILLLLIQNLTLINREYLTLHGYYATYYGVDILASLIKIALVALYWDEMTLEYLAWIILFAYGVGLLAQFLLIFIKLNTRLRWVVRLPDGKTILANSAKMKLGSLAYDSKEIFLAIVLTSAGTGVYSIFSYASKFTAVILEVVNAPIMSIFSAKLSHAHEEKRFSDIPVLLRQALTQTSILFILGTLFVYVSMPYIMSVFFGDKFSTEQVTQMGLIFMLLSVYTFTIVLESPFARAVSLFRYYGYGMRLNFIFSAIVATGFFILWLLNAQDAYLIFLGVLILAQLSNYWLYWKKYHQHMDERLVLPNPS